MLLALTAATLVLVAADPLPLSPALAQSILFLSEAPPTPCDGGTDAERITCLLTARYAKDPAAQKLALALFEKTGTVVGQLEAQPFDGGYRGKLRLVPRLPMGAHRKHLEWTVAAFDDFDAFLTGLGGPTTFRFKPLEFRYFESVKRRTPSAFAVDWAVAYNVSGSLFGSEAGVRNTLFHELFHLNDQARGNWSRWALGPTFNAIVAKCGVTTKCLEPYTPDSLKVIGGTYYAFQPGNGVGEYAADLARRYYVEHRALLHTEKGPRPFKCGPPENAKAWKLLVDEFFGGIDLVPACP